MLNNLSAGGAQLWCRRGFVTFASVAERSDHRGGETTRSQPNRPSVGVEIAPESVYLSDLFREVTDPDGKCREALISLHAREGHWHLVVPDAARAGYLKALQKPAAL